MAQKRIRNNVYCTPLEHNEKLSRLYHSNVYLKLENFQVTGSFKARLAFNGLLSLSSEERKSGIIAPTAGNHGISMAYAAKKLEVPAHIYLPHDVDKSKVTALENNEAIIKYFDTIEDARLAALETSKVKGYTFLSAYNSKQAIEAGGTIGLEIINEIPNIDTVIACLGGGGLTAGICIALKSINPNIEIWGVQTENSPTFKVWHQNGQPIELNIKSSIAEGLSGYIEPETITFPIINKYIDRIFTVTEQEIVDSMRTLLDFQYITEPSGSAGIAALKKHHKELEGKKIAAIITGRNISWSRLMSLIN